MNEEEKQAIKTVKQYKKCFVFETVHEESGERLNDYSNAINIVLNLIKRQQKELEVLKEENFDTIYMKAVADFKDKIREKIKDLKMIIEYDKPTYIETLKYTIEILQELLNE